MNSTAALNAHFAVKKPCTSTNTWLINVAYVNLIFCVCQNCIYHLYNCRHKHKQELHNLQQKPGYQALIQGGACEKQVLEALLKRGKTN